MLNQKKALAKLRAELEGREERKYWEYKKFGHLVHNYRNKGEEEKEKSTPQNRFAAIASRVIQCGVRDEIKVRWQKVEEVKCFRCWRVGHFKWEYPNIEVERQRRRKKEAVHVARPQKA